MDGQNRGAPVVTENSIFPVRYDARWNKLVSLGWSIVFMKSDFENAFNLRAPRSC